MLTQLILQYIKVLTTPTLHATAMLGAEVVVDVLVSALTLAVIDRWKSYCACGWNATIRWRAGSSGMQVPGRRVQRE